MGHLEKRGGSPRTRKRKERRVSLFDRWVRGEIKTKDFERLVKERQDDERGTD